MNKSIQEVKEEGINRGLENAADDWKSYALECVIAVAKNQHHFTVNDVRPLVKHSPYQTHDNRALGGVFATAKKLGFIEASGRSVPNKTGHGIHMQIWKSKVYGRAEITRDKVMELQHTGKMS